MLSHPSRRRTTLLDASASPMPWAEPKLGERKKRTDAARYAVSCRAHRACWSVGLGARGRLLDAYLGVEQQPISTGRTLNQAIAKDLANGSRYTLARLPTRSPGPEHRGGLPARYSLAAIITTGYRARPSLIIPAQEWGLSKGTGGLPCRLAPNQGC